MNTKTKKKWTRMTAEELAAATAEFDREMAGVPGSPLSRAGREKFERWRKKSRALARGRKRGRPRVGKGAQRVTIAMERGLLKRADTFARRRKLSRSELIALGLTELMARAG